MLTNLFFFLLLETIQPSYSAITSVLPETTMVAAVAQANSLTLFHESAPEKTTESLSTVLEARAVYAIDLETSTPFLLKIFLTADKPLQSQNLLPQWLF